MGLPQIYEGSLISVPKFHFIAQFKNTNAPSPLLEERVPRRGGCGVAACGIKALRVRINAG